MTDGQLWLPLEELAEKKINWLDVLPYYPEPTNEHQRMFNAQYDFLVNHNQKALDEIYRLGSLLALKMINQEINKNKNLKKIKPEERQEKANNASIYLTMRYVVDRSFYRSKSFLSYLQKRVMHELYYRTKRDDIVDYVDFDKFYKENEDAFITEDVNISKINEGWL